MVYVKAAGPVTPAAGTNTYVPSALKVTVPPPLVTDVVVTERPVPRSLVRTLRPATAVRVVLTGVVAESSAAEGVMLIVSVALAVWFAASFMVYAKAATPVRSAAGTKVYVPFALKVTVP